MIDNSDGRLSTDFSDISIVRRLNRDGEGEYRLNGARCRLVDVIEVLSDSGLGKEMHSVVSQGKVEQIVLSRPRERRLLIEEAAGLGKHRKRRRRAQLKLERTEDNLGRALDVEREARSRLRPLKRQAEAAELHERLERQTLEARYALARDAAREARAALAGAEERARAARSRARRGASGCWARWPSGASRPSRRSPSRPASASASRRGLFSARSAAERIAMRLERVARAGPGRRRSAAPGARASWSCSRPRPRATPRARPIRCRTSGCRARPRRTAARRAPPGTRSRRPTGSARSSARSAGSRPTARHACATRSTSLEAELERARGEHARLQQAAARAPGRARRGRGRDRAARAARRDAERAVEAARARAAQAGAELAAVNQFLRTAAAAPDGSATLAQSLDVAPGYELALAAALGPRLSAALVDDLAAGERLLEAPATRAAQP